jgi:hypothetical protein
MRELMKKDYDWRPEIAKLRMSTLLLFADHDAVLMRHIAEFFALFGAGVHDAGWEGKPQYARARLAIVPVQDVLGLGSEARLNTPGRTTGNWRWRLERGQLTREHAERLRAVAARTGRAKELGARLV